MNLDSIVSSYHNIKKNQYVDFSPVALYHACSIQQSFLLSHSAKAFVARSTTPTSPSVDSKSREIVVAATPSSSVDVRHTEISRDVKDLFSDLVVSRLVVGTPAKLLSTQPPGVSISPSSHAACSMCRDWEPKRSLLHQLLTKVLYLCRGACQREETCTRHGEAFVLV